jgi:nicotinate-nucleotide pyrophosphorylase (carboxylating)
LGDRTSEAILNGSETGTAHILAKSPGVICGIDIARQVFAKVDPTLIYSPQISDGDIVKGEREIIATVSGSLKGILIGERLSLNFLQYMSGIATEARHYSLAVQGTKSRVVDTRKTTPGLRTFAKYAVTVGGAYNHRFGLFDGILIKDNHIVAAGSITKAVARARENSPHTLRIEVETKNLTEVQEALDSGAEIILLDNMPLDILREAVQLIGDQALTEASGGVNLSTIKDIASIGVDLISVGALTHSARAMDISLDIIKYASA